MKEKPRFKAKEIAKQLGVSPATVSLAVNDRPGVNADTKRRVLGAIAERENGRSLLYGETILLLRYINKDNPDWPEDRALFQREYAEFFRMVQEERMELRLQNVYSPAEFEDAIKSAGGKALGVVLRADELPSESQKQLARCSVPLVVCASDLLGESWDVVNFHNEKAVCDGMELLTGRGHRDIVYLRNLFSMYQFDTRRRAYRRFVAEHPGLGLKAQLVPTGEYVEEAADAVCRFLAERSRLPDAVFSENYMVSVALSLAVRRLGISVPGDLSVIGIDAIQPAVQMPYRMNHFVVPHAEHMKVACELLFARICHAEAAPFSKEVRLAMKYVEGDTLL